jgi:hypothetical protein
LTPARATTREASSKRKIEQDIASPSTTKKQMLTSQKDNVSDESFRTAHTQQVGMCQPVAIPNAPTPLNNVERWRLRGWRWPEAVVMSSYDRNEEKMSPTRTSFGL